jgi:SNF2 family DNA or RNA helicase
VIDFFKKNNQKILIHPSKYEEFQQNILSKLENHVSIRYAYLKPATKKQIAEQGFDQPPERLIYLSDRENFVSIIPVVKYGNVEVPVLSRKQIRDTDQNGNVFTIDRNDELETRFTSILLRQHPYFSDQLHHGDSFYLHKDRFLDEQWFLDAFEEWNDEKITILGFNDLKNNQLNPNKAKVSINVISGIDWFNTALSVGFGKQKASLKQLHKSLRNKSKFVQLDDGTMGILPDEWIRKFAEFFESGEIEDEWIKTPKNNFADISRMYNDEMLTQEVKEELALYESKFSHFETIEEVAVPVELQATLRDYQKQGLNWLNFLDEFNFGGCLADDMGLGKTIQIIAFILLQRSKKQQNTNLVIVPTSLLFNWQDEFAKFAPSIKVFTNYGSTKLKNLKDLDQYEVILTTYGMLLSDIRFLKDYRFNYIFLDESQAIKNPDSQRHKAARMLQSRNKVVLTGTPIENNTFDIYGQLSFACPGLLGNKQQFRDLYSIPIDKFDNSKRARELQKKISPFILRRTKKQVATELPEKTEMVIYCEMGTEQRKVYATYEQEFRDYLANKDEEDIAKSSMHVLKGLTKLRQICNSPELIKDEVFLGNSSSKIEVLMEQIENKSPQHKILVFSQFVSMLDLIKKELQTRNISFEYLTGQTTNRAAKVNEFQKNDSVRVFLISLKAGGTGLNLTEADYVYLVDPWWNPAVENQAIDRCYRIGQKKNVIAVRLICPDTIEEKILKLQESKTILANDLIKTDGSVLKSLSKNDLLGLLDRP